VQDIGPRIASVFCDGFVPKCKQLSTLMLKCPPNNTVSRCKYQCRPVELQGAKFHDAHTDRKPHETQSTIQCTVLCVTYR
jgi:hypothetical protein